MQRLRELLAEKEQREREEIRRRERENRERKEVRPNESRNREWSSEGRAAFRGEGQWEGQRGTVDVRMDLGGRWNEEDEVGQSEVEELLGQQK